MSCVNNVILVTFPSEEPAVAALNMRLIAERRGFLTGVHAIATGGTKNLECGVYLAAFNYMDIAILQVHIAAISWKKPEHVEVFWKDENDNVFSHWRLIGGKV